MNPGNRRPQRSQQKVVCKKTKDVKPKTLNVQSIRDKPSSRSSKKSDTKEALDAPTLTGDNSKTAKATLKDLCADDKKRVANLIKELARLGEAKETMSGQLESERQIFERRIQDLVDQQDRISTERESVKAQLAECQKLLARYQEYLEQYADCTKVPTHLPITSDKVALNVHHHGSSLSDPVVCPNYNQPNSCLPSRHMTLEDKMPESHLFPVYIESDVERELSVGEKPFLLRLDEEDSSFSDRPFTKRIDRIIAGEKAADGPFSEQLPDPAMLSEGQTGKHTARGKLVHDTDHQFLTRLNRYNLSNHCGGIDFKIPLKMTAPGPSCDSDEFVNCFNKLGPDERRRELLAQKMALLEEQKRLKAVLVQQEQMLQMKQDHLHRQQEIQQKRLKYFESTGTFPAHHQYKLPPKTYERERGREDASGHSTRQLNNVANEIPENVTELPASQDSVVCDRAMAVQPHCHVSSSYEHESFQRPTNNGPPENMPQNAHYFKKQVAETRAIIDGQHMQQEVAKRMVSRATSPIRLAHLDEATASEPVMHKDSLQVEDNQLRRSRMNRNGSVRAKQAVKKPPHTEALELIDLVNNVDEASILSTDGSIHVYTSAVRHSQVATEKAYSDSDKDSYINDINSYDEEDPDIEESRVLEDVFFIK